MEDLIIQHNILNSISFQKKKKKNVSVCSGHILARYRCPVHDLCSADVQEELVEVCFVDHSPGLGEDNLQ